MNIIKKCLYSAIKNYRVIKILFLVLTGYLIYDELRKEL